MASYTIQERQGRSGVRYRVMVRTVNSAAVESKTFESRADAEAWGLRRKGEVEAGAVGTVDRHTVGDLLRAYLQDQGDVMSRSKRYSLDMMSDCDLAKVRVSDLSAHHVVNFCRDRRDGGAGPSTIAGDVSHLRVALKVARAGYGINIDDRAVVEAYPTLHTLRLIGKSNRRSRRPVGDELDRLREGLRMRQANSPAGTPFVDILDFSILSCMRIGEVCAILWADLDDDEGAVLVRNRKDPRKKAGNHMMVPLLGGAFDIAKRQKRTDDPRIFPFKATSITAGFQRVRADLGIEDLRYHDLRREGASRLFEQGYSIDEVAQVTGHRNINTLWQIYTELYPSRLTRR